MFHEEVIEDMSPENMESGDILGQFDPRFVRMWGSIILENDYPFDFFEDWELRKVNVMPPTNVIKAHVFDFKSTLSGVQRSIQNQYSSMPLPKSLSHGLFDQLVTETGKSQLDIYLDESNLDFHYHEDMNVLQWWKCNNDRFPDLSILACDLLSVSITTVASTRDFCMGSRIFNKYKDRILPMNMDARFCTRSWLYNFRSFDGEDEGSDFEEMMSDIDGLVLNL
ncbi:hypothetical protein P8452_39577 [Trifolium repens]|nr:hypothetical protein P8452_39577 [Trifolium repens]